MTSSLSNLVNNLAEGIHKNKDKDGNCFLEYESVNDNLIKYKCSSCSQNSKLHGVNYVPISEKTGKDAEELLNACTLNDMMERISKAIRIKLKNVKNKFNGSFMEESPLPCELLILLNLLMNGSNHEEPGISLPVKALTPIIS